VILARKYSVLFALELILLAAGVLRFYRLDLNSLWIDECFTYLSTTGAQFRTFTALPVNVIMTHPPPLTDPAYAKPWWQILRPDTQDIHPPLYFFLLRLWVSVFGWQDTHARAFSILAGLLTIAFMYATVSELSGRVSGLFTAAIITFSQAQIDFSREARSYMLVMMLGSAAAWAMVRIEKRGLSRLRLLGLAVTCIAMPFTHYFACAIVVTLIVYSWLRLQGESRHQTLRVCIGALLIFLVVWSPILYLQAHGASKRGTTYYSDGTPAHYWLTFLRLTILPVRYLYEPLPNMEMLSRAMPIILLIALALLPRRPDLLLWILWIPINVLPSLLIDLTTHSMSLDLRRYTISASLGVYALMAALCNHMRPSLRYVLPCAVLMGCLLHFTQSYSTSGRTRQQWREFAKEYEQLAEPGDLTIMLGQRPLRDDYTYFLCIGRYLPSWPGATLLMNGPASPSLMRQISAYHHILVIGGPCKEWVIDKLPGAVINGERQRAFVGQIYRLTLPESSPALHPG
jgi:hypothetical protein